jgi:hypothetical protein
MPATLPERFLLGVNYPWVNYGQDFGRSPSGACGVSTAGTHKTVTEDFKRIRDTGVTLVRWFLLCDGRSGLSLRKGVPAGPDDLLFADVGAALDIAQQSGLQLCLSLLDYPWMQNRRDASSSLPNQDVLKFPAGREALVELVLIPLFEKFRAHPALSAWEVANEPEWAIREFVPLPEAGLHFAEFNAFAREIVDAVHEFSHAPVTLGSARLLWFRAWSELALDFQQVHYFPQSERDQDADLAAQLRALEPEEAFERPLWLGALPACDPGTPEYSLEAALDTCKAAGLAGAAVWRWRGPEPGGPDEKYGAVDPEALRAWLARTGVLRV